ncbi:MAG: CHASE2 domain-containing protein [Myxococcota bacterium]|nr:CHASE2 domain-containing protein [Myxococcota bacterium]
MNRRTPILLSTGISLIFVFIHIVIEAGVFHTGWLSQNSPLRLLERKALDFKFASQSKKNLPMPQVVVAGIDEKSIDKYGLWPWNRTVIADFITQTTKGGAKVIAFDVNFADENRDANYHSVKTIRQSFEASSLLPGDDSQKSIESYLEQINQSQRSTQEKIRDLEVAIGKLSSSQKDRLSNVLSALRKSSTKASNLLNQTQSEFSRLKQRTSAFHEFLQHENKSISPDYALAQAIAQSPETILGYHNYFDLSYVVGVEDDEIDANIKRIQKSAVGKIYDRLQVQLGDTIVDSLEPVEVNIEQLNLGSEIVAVQAPLKVFAEKANYFGYFNAHLDPDGPVRQIPLLLREKSRIYPALSLLAASRYFNYDIFPLIGHLLPNTLSAIDFGGPKPVPTTPQGIQLINYYKAPEKYIPTFSIADFIDGSLAAQNYKDKVIYVGMTALGLYDMRPNPFSPSTPGVYMHAMATQNMIDGKFLERVYGVAIWEAIGFLLIGILMGWALPRLPPWTGLLATMIAIVSLYLLDMTFIFPSGHWMLVVFPTLQMLAVFLGITIYGYLTEGKEKKYIRSAFQQYLSKNVVDEVLQDKNKLSLGGEKRVCSVLFSDIRGFTSISEQLSPEQLTSILNAYLSPMTKIVFQNNGTLDKYMGDAIMAIFGAPVKYEDHPANAAIAALQMLQSLGEIQEALREKGLKEDLRIGIGIHTGEMSVGNMGSDVRFDYTVMGDNVNLASRLEGINKQYGTEVIVSESTYRAAGAAVYGRRLDSVRVKGKLEPINIYELLGIGAPNPNDEKFVLQFEQGWQFYHAQEWDQAQVCFQKIYDDLRPGDKASELYIKRCENMKVSPPGKEWDGVFTMMTK